MEMASESKPPSGQQPQLCSNCGATKFTAGYAISMPGGILLFKPNALRSWFQTLQARKCEGCGKVEFFAGRKP
jgi:hypothetical protein